MASATMATLQTMVFSSPDFHSSQKPRILITSISSTVFVTYSFDFSKFAQLGMTSRPVYHISYSSFTGQALTIPISSQISHKLQKSCTFTLTTQMAKPTFQVIPVGDITGFFMIDEEGTLQSVDASVKFGNGRPAAIEAKHVMQTPRDWDRFIRFMARYANVNGLQIVKS